MLKHVHVWGLIMFPFFLSPRQCLWKDSSAVPRMGRARCVCCRCFSLNPVFIPSEIVSLSVTSSWLSPLSPPAGAQSCPVLSKFHSCFSVKRRWRGEERLYQRHAQGPGSVSACHAEAAGHSRCVIWRIQPGVWWGGVKPERGMTAVQRSEEPVSTSRVVANCWKKGARCIQCIVCTK